MSVFRRLTRCGERRKKKKHPQNIMVSTLSLEQATIIMNGDSGDDGRDELR